MFPTGQQFEISHGDQKAIITEQGATLRSYVVNDRAVVSSFAENELPTGCQGQQLLPWPNRIRDGKYRFDGDFHQLPINEHDRQTALHGLACWVPWTTVEHTESKLTQKVVVLPQPGWPGVVEATITHELTDDGLVVSVKAENIGEKAFPFGYAAHPYFVLDGAPIDEWTLEAAFDDYLVVEPDRLLPIAIDSVEGTSKDFRETKVFGDTELDTAFANPAQTDERWSVTMSHGDASVEMWADAPLSWLQIYTPGDRASLAVEPMTCGPDAFNEGPTHDGLIRLDSGQHIELQWGVRAG